MNCDLCLLLHMIYLSEYLGKIEIEFNIIQLLTYVEVDMECYWTVNFILTDAKRRSI